MLDYHRLRDPASHGRAEARTHAIFALRGKTAAANIYWGFAEYSWTVKGKGVSKLIKRMAPQVGLEPTTLRLTAGEHMLEYTYSQ